MRQSVRVLICVFVFGALFGGSMRAEGRQSLVLTPGASAESGPVPNTVPFKAMKDLRVEFRLHDYSAPPDWNSWIIRLPDFAVRFVQGELQLHVSDLVDEPNSKMVALDLKGRKKDILARFQRNFSTRKITLEIWDIDGTNYSGTTYELTGMAPTNWAGKNIAVGGGTMQTRLAYLRLYSTLVPLKSSVPAHADGDLGDWEFDGGFGDKSNRGLDMKVSGGRIGFSVTPSYPAKARFGEFGAQRTFRAGKGSLVLDGSQSFTSNDDSALKFSWQQVSGPSTGRFEDTNAAKTAFTAAAPGTYTIRLTVSDSSGGSASTDVKMGAVPTDDDGIVIMGAKAAVVFGPLTMSGTSPWPWYDSTEMANADVLRPMQTAPPHFGAHPLSGTVTPTGERAMSMVGTGTHFLTDLASCSSKGGNPNAYSCSIAGVKSYDALAGGNHYWLPDVSCAAGASLDVNGLGAQPLFWDGKPVAPANCPARVFRRLFYNAGARRVDVGGEQPLIWFWWNAPDGPGTGRSLNYMKSVEDDTHLSLASGHTPPLNVSRNMQYSLPNAGELATYWNYLSQPGNSLDYYDNVLALYRVYYRTGIDTYLDQARTLADNWWKYSDDYGYAIAAPRVIGLLGMIARAMDGRPEMWAGIDFNLNFPWPVNQMFDVKTPQPVGTTLDGREMGYATRFVLRAAAFMPGADKHALYCGRLHNMVANWWVSTQDDLGQWEEDTYTGNISYPGARLNGHFGSSPYRAGMAALALEESYDVLRDSCKDPETAARALGAARRFGDFAHDYSGGAGYGQIPNVQYASNTAYGIHAWAKSQFTELPNTKGTLSVTKGSNIVVGSGTNFTSLFPSPAQYIGIPAQRTNGNSCSSVMKVASVQSDTRLTLETPWTCETTSGIDGTGYGWVAAPAARTDCAALGSPKAQACEGTPDPSLSHELHAIWAWIYWQTGETKYKTWAQQTLGTDYGGPKGGPGTPTEPAGPFATGKAGNFGDALPSCSPPDNAPPPCGGYGPAFGLGKSFGFSTGAGNAPNALAYIVLGDRRQAARK
jgi:hypothetical protein